MDHSVVKLFEQRAELLGIQQSPKALGDAIADLADWMGLVADDLTEDDWALLAEIGGMLYRARLRQHMEK